MTMVVGFLCRDGVVIGADGFGFGSELFRPEYSIEDIARRARDLVQAFDLALGLPRDPPNPLDDTATTTEGRT